MKQLLLSAFATLALSVASFAQNGINLTYSYSQGSNQRTLNLLVSGDNVRFEIRSAQADYDGVFNAKDYTLIIKNNKRGSEQLSFNREMIEKMANAATSYGSKMKAQSESMTDANAKQNFISQLMNRNVALTETTFFPEPYSPIAPNKTKVVNNRVDQASVYSSHNGKTYYDVDLVSVESRTINTDEFATLQKLSLVLSSIGAKIPGLSRVDFIPYFGNDKTEKLGEGFSRGEFVPEKITYHLYGEENGTTLLSKSTRVDLTEKTFVIE